MVHFPGFMSLQSGGEIDNLIQADKERGGDGYAGGGRKGRPTQT